MLALPLLLAACTGDGGTDDTGECAPTLTMTSPADSATVCGSPLVVTVDVTGFTLTNADIEDPPPCTGHLHVYLNGQEAAQADQETVEIQDVADGAYQLKADLALADHSALNPYVGTDPIYVTVDNATCTE
jgi:hypothetical protein